MANREADRTNIVLIMSDQHHAGIMGCAGDATVLTPNLDGLAARGVRFNQAYTSCPVCVPARMGFMTAKWPSAIRNWCNKSVLPTYEPTFAHGLGAAGCEAVLCGKMHFVGPDQFHGFERRLVGECVGGNLFPPDMYRCADGNWTGGGTYPVRASGYGYQGFQYYDEVVTRTACAFIAGRKPDERPYALVVGLICPHNPYVCDRELFDYYYARLAAPPGAAGLDAAALHPDLRMQFDALGMGALDAEQHRRARAAYYGLVTEMDRNVGRIMQAVEAAGDGRETTVIYCADHGDMVGEYGLWYKGNFMDAAARIPLIIAGAAARRSGVTVESVTSLIDVGPTVLALMGAEPLPDAAGRSLAGFLSGAGEASAWPNEAFAEEHGSAGRGPSFMIRRDRWKFIYYHRDGSCRLFDMGPGGGEHRDLADDPDHAALVAAFRQETLARWDGKFVQTQLERERRAQQVVRRCGHPLWPHPIVEPVMPPAQHDFDRRQLPDFVAGGGGAHKQV
ncbi:MAG: sulfatase-like hydrolase/transferase [Candidatus Marinimicrobia bacterium]|nr:sulfatase-like hydrolase/transferase [Candidatus Neomarinimicrobiota bacterium]